MSNVEFDLEKVRQKTVANIEKILLQGGLKMVVKAKENLIANKHHVTGRLSKSVTMNQEGLKLEFGSNVDYAITIETGKVIVEPSLDDIEEWLDRKIKLGHIPLNSWLEKRKLTITTNGKTYIRKKPLQSDSERLAKIKFRLALKITERIQSTRLIKNFHPFLEPAFSGELKEIREKISQAVEK